MVGNLYEIDSILNESNLNLGETGNPVQIMKQSMILDKSASD